MPQTTGLPAGPTSTHRTQPTNYNCKRNAPGARGSICRPRAPLCLPFGGLVVCPSWCWLSAPRSSLSCTNGIFRLPDAIYPSSRAQKCRFCARNARKWGFRKPKAHKNLDFVLEMPENRGPEHKKSTKTSILCSKSLKTRVPKSKSAQKPRFCARIAKAAVLSWNFINEREAGAHSQNAC